MKRTRENWLGSTHTNVEGISGLRFFQGEDLDYQQRTQAFKETQRKWIEEKKAENLINKQRESEEEKLYALQEQQILQARGILEADLTRKQRMMEEATKEFNRQQAIQKKMKEKREREQKLLEEKRDLEHQETVRKTAAWVNPLS